MVKIAHLSDAEFDQYVDEMYRKEAFSVDCVRFLMQQKKEPYCVRFLDIAIAYYLE